MSIALVIIKILVTKSNLFFQYSAIVESFDFFFSATQITSIMQLLKAKVYLKH